MSGRASSRTNVHKRDVCCGRSWGIGRVAYSYADPGDAISQAATAV